MKRALIIAALTLAAVGTATFGLIGNASFARNVPVRVPASAILVDDHGSEQPVAAIRSSDAPPSSSTPPVTTRGHIAPVAPATTRAASTAPDDRGRADTAVPIEPGDDNNRATAGRAAAGIEPGDDGGRENRTGSTTREGKGSGSGQDSGKG